MPITQLPRNQETPKPVSNRPKPVARMSRRSRGAMTDFRSEFWAPMPIPQRIIPPRTTQDWPKKTRGAKKEETKKTAIRIGRPARSNHFPKTRARPAQSHRDGVIDWNYWAGDRFASLKVVGDEREIGKTGGDKSARNQIKPVGTRKSFGFQTMTCLQLTRIREKGTGQENNRDSKERGDEQQRETGSITTM